MLPDDAQSSTDIIRVPAYLGPNYDKFWEEAGFTQEQLRHLTRRLSGIMVRTDAPLYWNSLEFHTMSYETSELMGFLEQVPPNSKVHIEQENKRFGRKKNEISHGYLIEAFFWDELDPASHSKIVKRYQQLEDERKDRIAQGQLATQKREVDRIRKEASKLGYRVVKKST